ncbi:methyltransferase regulatory domain-containing protein [Rubinisphaera brasiliensis]|uniref:Methyltransferase regulatory domain-containing protein n=1 Tax=Rubinisphaera brasiliensis (strain ATCC 49424 / DSM 5305 / JCM 21570 / IAM 15109 / NBRC 103401 / IFAM 1448) TaxID=756272 RepID=F0SFF5_RUBBR|nr:class I SAM-dependent methyltransferase [Rubinisphaera brasiliensis]ADY59362.1 Methyltransferase regulatory domain-containing protein [Rubinisphaera brasiliensis DSM 5305]
MSESSPESAESEQVTFSYDQLPYDSHPFDRTHPDHLATMGRLFGLQSPDPASSRVLEIGCAAGGNLIPMAVSLPGSEFVGFDLSRRELEDGQNVVDAIGLKNVRLEHADILDFHRPGETFDYIVCHGVFSWVSAEARQRIFEICRDHLSENGIAYISYNTFPGWFMRGMVRQMLCFHARQFSDPQTQVEQARALLDFLNKAAKSYDPTYHALLQRELEIVKHRQDSYLFHEHLEQDNDPLFFYQFAEQASSHGLRYLSETQFSEMVPSRFSPEITQTLQTLSRDIIHAEQYLDFLRNRTFRRTLICRADRTLQRELGADQLQRMSVRCGLKLQPSPVPLHQPGEQQFKNSRGLTATISHPVLKQVLAGLCSRWPEYVPFTELPNFANDETGPVIRDSARWAEDREEIGSLCMQLLGQDLAELRSEPIRFATKLPDRPQTSPLVLHQLEKGPFVTNLRHEMIKLNDMDRHLLRCLSEDAEGRRRYFEERVKNGELVITAFDGEGDREVDAEQLDELIAHGLKRLADQALILPA